MEEPFGTEYSSLVEYCRTPRQKQMIELAAQGKSRRQIAKELGCVKGTVDACVERIRKYAACKGVSPEHDMTHSCPDPFIVKGVSSYYGKDGTLTGQWVKTTVDTEKLRLLQEVMADEFAKDLPKYKPQAAASKLDYAKMLAVIPIPDVHIGQLAWGKETGNDYDVEIAETTLRNTVSSLIDRTPACEECLVESLGDLLHVDNAVGMTERSGNVLDVDGRYARILQVGIRSIRYVIEYALSRHKRVTVINCCGNHDDLGSLWLSAALKNIYENEKRITVVDDPTPRHYYRFGKVLLGATHGQDIKPKDLPLVMASERKEDWGATDYHIWNIGHIHHLQTTEVGGCVVEAFRAICAKDAWTNAKGFLGGRDMKAIIYDKECGEVERHIVAIR